MSVKILVCDDQPMLRELLSGAISSHRPDAQVVTVENGAEAESRLENEKFDLVFLDVEMPVQDGFTTLEHIRARQLDQGARVVMCTGCSDEAHLVRGWQLRADFYLTKPFDLDEVGEVVKSAMEAAVA